MNYKHKYLKYKHKYLNTKEKSINIYHFSIKQPWFDFIKNNIKTVEGRLNKGIFQKIKKIKIKN